MATTATDVSTLSAQTAGNPNALSLWYCDYTQPKKVITKLRGNGVTDFRNYFKQHPNFLSDLLSSVKVKDVNEGMVELFEANNKSQILNSIEKIYLPETYKVFGELIIALAENRPFFSSETIVKTLRGHIRNIFFIAELPQHQQDQYNVVINVIDTTKQMYFQQALQLSEERYRSLVEASTAIVWTTDAYGNFVIPQSSWEAYTGQPWHKHQGWGWAMMMHPDDRERILTTWTNAIKKPSVFTDEGRIWHNESQRYRYFTLRVVPILNQENSVREWIGTFTDIDDQKQAESRHRVAEERLKQWQKELDVISKESIIDELASGIAHELNQPLTVISSYAQACAAGLQGNNIDLPELARIMEEIVTEARYAGEVLHRIRNLYSAGRINTSPTNMNILISRMIEIINNEASLELNIVVQASDNIPDVMMDEIQMGQVILNIMRNAVDALTEHQTETPVITIKATTEIKTLNVTITNNGPKIKKKVINKMFDPFFTTKQSGIGMGLSICRTIVEAHDGQLSVQNHGGKNGVSFCISLPLNIKEQANDD